MRKALGFVPGAFAFQSNGTPSNMINTTNSPECLPSCTSENPPVLSNLDGGKATAPRGKKVLLRSLILDDDMQPRSRMRREAIREYRLAYRHGPDRLPPITVARLQDGEDPDALVLVDGYHRYEAARLAGLDHLPVNVLTLTTREARWVAAKANLAHGVPIPRSDKRRVFRRYVEAQQNIDSDGQLKSSRVIARELGSVTHQTVLNWMKADFPEVYAAMGRADPSEAEDLEPMSYDPFEDDLHTMELLARDLQRQVAKTRRKHGAARTAAALAPLVGRVEAAGGGIPLSERLVEFAGRRPVGAKREDPDDF